MSGKEAEGLAASQGMTNADPMVQMPQTPGQQIDPRMLQLMMSMRGMGQAPQGMQMPQGMPAPQVQGMMGAMPQAPQAPQMPQAQYRPRGMAGRF